MLFKHSSKKSLVTVPKPKAKVAKKLSIGEKPKKSVKSKGKKSEAIIRIPRTCLESPVSSKPRKTIKRMTSCETLRVVPSFKLAKHQKKLSVNKEKLHLNKGKTLKHKDFEEIVISPIKKIKLDFLNKDDQSIMKVLEII